MSNKTKLLYPLLFEPVLKDYIWGGRNLEKTLGRILPDEGVIAESWEIAAHEDGATVVINGAFAGQSLIAVNQELGVDLVGRRSAWALERGKFPLLVKLLDAQDKLSVQVHPGDKYALAHEGNELGKTEMWVVLQAQPAAEIILGVRRGTTPQLFRDAVEESTVEHYLHHLKVKAGDFVCVPSGTLHAILGGVLIAEIQQNSNTTYRVYDWGRTSEGRARPLHLAKALDVINFNVVEPQLPAPELIETSPQAQRSLLCTNQYFITEKIVLAPGGEFIGELNGETLEIWGVIDGEIEVNDTHLEAVRFTLLPAAMGPFRVTTKTGATCLRARVTD